MTDAARATGPRATIRLDKWLWQARFFKTRTQATSLVAEGRVRLNSERVSKPARAVGEGDVLTFPQGEAIKVIRIVAVGIRRGPAPEAQTLYDDLTPPPASDDQVNENPPNPRFEGKGRPGKRERRNMLTEGPRGGDDLLE